MSEEPFFRDASHLCYFYFTLLFYVIFRCVCLLILFVFLFFFCSFKRRTTNYWHRIGHRSLAGCWLVARNSILDRDFSRQIAHLQFKRATGDHSSFRQHGKSSLSDAWSCRRVRAFPRQSFKISVQWIILSVELTNISFHKQIRLCVLSGDQAFCERWYLAMLLLSSPW